MSIDPTPVRRSYRGVSPDQRDAERRARLIDAAMRLFAEQRTAEVPIVVVCRAAGVTTRQFYEIFRERGELFTAVYEHSAEVGLRHTLTSVADETRPLDERIRAMLDGLFRADEHSELGQALAVLFVVGATSQELRKRRSSAVANAGEAMGRLLHVSPVYTGVLIAACVQMLELAWLDDAIATADESVEALMDLFAAHLPST